MAGLTKRKKASGLNQSKELTMVGVMERVKKEQREERKAVKTLEKARRNAGFWGRLEQKAQERGYDLEEKVAEKYLDHLESEDSKASLSSLGTLMNIRGSHTKEYIHVAPTNLKMEITDNRIPERFGNIPLEELERLAMEPAKQVVMEVIEKVGG
jgi:hypothetical protein